MVSRAASWAALAALIAGGCREPTVGPVEPMDLGFVDASLGRPPPERAPGADAGPAEAGQPADTPAPAPARLNGDRIDLAGPLHVTPRARFPEPETRQLLDAVAKLMHERDDILLLRIDAFSSRNPGARALSQRREVDESQQRADAVLRYLWKERNVSAERLEAVGHGFRPGFSDKHQRWPIVLRVAQWRNARP